MIKYEIDALEYLSKLSEGGMRDAITLLDKCLSYSDDLTLKNVITALGIVDYDIMFELTEYMLDCDSVGVIKLIEQIHTSGKDLKQFVKSYMQFVFDICKYRCTHSFNYIQIPQIDKYEEVLNSYNDSEFNYCVELLNILIRLNADIKWETSPKSLIESTLMLNCIEGGELKC